MSEYIPRHFVYEYVKSKRFYVLVYKNSKIVPELSGKMQSSKPKQVEIEVFAYRNKLNPLDPEWGQTYVVVPTAEKFARLKPKFSKFKNNTPTITNQQGRSPKR